MGLLEGAGQPLSFYGSAVCVATRLGGILLLNSRQERGKRKSESEKRVKSRRGAAEQKRNIPQRNDLT